jgi:gas vesicle protein GvpL/GvpF
MAERVYIYAIAGANAPAPEDVSGFGGPLYIIPYGELAAVVSQIRVADTADTAYAAESDSEAPAATAESLLRHEAVVEAVRAGGPALPVRFGTALADSDEVMRALAKHYDRLRDDLRRIGDKVEMGVSVLWRSTETPAGTPARGADAEGADRRPGLAYLRARQVEYRQAEAVRERAQALAREVDTALQQLALEWRRSLCPSDRLALRDQYLLERERIDAFERAFDELRRSHQEARFLLSGPWPPYSFVTPLARRERETQSPEQERMGAHESGESGRAAGALGMFEI